ncbi:hypothetical protein DYB26_010492, partial [Aphanomyces astaci]
TDDMLQHSPPLTSSMAQLRVRSRLDDMVDANDKLVSYLLETGSIMALAERLDQEDDSLWTVAEEDRPAIIHA